MPSTLIGERVVLRYDPTLPPGNRRLFVHHGGRHVGEARLVDSYANARVRRADLRLDPAGDDDNDAGGAPVARSSDPPDKRPAEGLPVVEQLELQFEAPSAAPGQPATKQSQTPDRLRSGPAGENRRTNGAGTPNGVAIPARCPVVGLPVCYRADCRHYQHGGCVHPKAGEAAAAAEASAVTSPCVLVATGISSATASISRAARALDRRITPSR